MNQGAEAEAVSFGAPERRANAQSAERVRSVTSDRLVPPVATLPDRAATARAGLAAERLTDAWDWLSSGGHLTSRPPSLRDAHAYVHEAADYDALLLKVPRLAWGYGWLAFKALLHFLEWVTKSPVTFVTAAVLITLAVLFL